MSTENNFNTGFRPHQIAKSAWVAPGAVVVGDVWLRGKVSIWFGAVLRADTERIEIGEGCNLQDGVIAHADPGFPLIVGEYVTVGHRAILHGAQIGKQSLIGMGSIIMNGAQIGEACLVGANSLITEGKVFEDGMLIMGSPAKAIRFLTDAEKMGIQKRAESYILKAEAFSREY